MFWGLIPTFVEVIGEKLVGGAFLPSLPPTPILNRVKNIFFIEHTPPPAAFSNYKASGFTEAVMQMDC